MDRRGGPEQRRVSHAEDHRDVGHHQKDRDAYRMSKQPGIGGQRAAEDAQIQQRHAHQRHDAGEIRAHCDHVRRSAPLTSLGRTGISSRPRNREEHQLLGGNSGVECAEGTASAETAHRRNRWRMRSSGTVRQLELCRDGPSSTSIELERSVP